MLSRLRASPRWRRCLTEAVQCALEDLVGRPTAAGGSSGSMMSSRNYSAASWSPGVGFDLASAEKNGNSSRGARGPAR